VQATVKSIFADDLTELDRQVQAMVKKQFTALVHVCLTTANVTKNVAMAMRQVAEGFVNARLQQNDTAELFLNQFADEEAVTAEIASLYEEAMPEASAARLATGRAELCVFAAPATPSGQRLGQVARKALTDVEFVTAVTTDDVLLYREWSNLNLSDLEQVGTEAQDAYRQMIAAEHFTPHTRSDVYFALPTGV
jgi:hypothetical protein